MDIVALPAFDDNYIWLLIRQSQAVVIDPGDAVPVQSWLAEHDLQLQGILITHHHDDHVGGVDTLREQTGAHVRGPAREAIPEPFEKQSAGDRFELLGLDWRVLDTPGHTAGHISYVAEAAGQAPLLFCGDTLFSGGCGRIFDGTPEQMLHSLDQLAALPATTKVFAAHEYTLSNLRFAQAAEASNRAIERYKAQCQALRDQDQPTLPTTIGQELDINPFLRSRLPAVRRTVQSRSPEARGEVAVFAALREWKNNF